MILRVLAFLLFTTPAFAQGPSSLSNLTSGNAIGRGDLFYDVQVPGIGGVKVTGTQLGTFIGQIGLVDPNFTNNIDGSTWATTLNRIGQNQSAAGTGVAGSANQQALTVQAFVPVTGAAAAYEKVGVISYCATIDPSPNAVNTHDCVGGDFRGWAFSPNLTARVFGINPQVQFFSGSDGLGTAGEFDVFNGGTDQAAVDTTTSKYGATFVPIGPNPSTAAMYIEGGSPNSTWHNGVFAHVQGISQGGNFLNLDNSINISGTSVFSVNVTGNMAAYSINNSTFAPIGADPTGATDSTTAIQTCLTAAGVANTKGTCLVAGGKYKVLGSFTIPRGATLSCGDSFYDQEDAIASYGNMPAIQLASTATIGTTGPSATIKNCLIYRLGMTFPAADSSAFAGIAVNSSDPSLTIKDSIFLGFDTAIYLPAGGRPFIYHVLADCTGVTHACIDAEFGNTDSGVMRDVKLQPLATGNGNCTNSVRAGTGLRLGGGGGPTVNIDEIVSQNYQVAQFDLEAFTQAGKIWADNINGAASCGSGGFGTSIGVKIGAGASIVAQFIQSSANQTEMQILSNGASSYVGVLTGSCTGQDAIQLGDATHSGNLDAGLISMAGGGCSGAPASTARYGINVLHSSPGLNVQQANFTAFNSSAGVGPYFQSTPAVVLATNGGPLFINSLFTDLTTGANPWAPTFSAGAGSAPLLETLTASLGACTGLGSGSCSSSLANGLQGFAQLSPTGSPASSGSVTVTFPLGDTNGFGYSCVSSLSGGSSNWPASSSVQAATFTSLSIQLNWTAGSALTAGQTYRISYICRPQ